jgi:hypothetical protein
MADRAATQPIDLTPFVAGLEPIADDPTEQLSGLKDVSLTLDGYWQGPPPPVRGPLFEVTIEMTGEPGRWNQADADELMPGYPVDFRPSPDRRLYGHVDRAEVNAEGSGLKLVALVGHVDPDAAP